MTFPDRFIRIGKHFLSHINSFLFLSLVQSTTGNFSFYVLRADWSRWGKCTMMQPPLSRFWRRHWYCGLWQINQVCGWTTACEQTRVSRRSSWECWHLNIFKITLIIKCARNVVSGGPRVRSDVADVSFITSKDVPSKSCIAVRARRQFRVWLLLTAIGSARKYKN